MPAACRRPPRSLDETGWPSWCVIFIRCASEMPYAVAIGDRAQPGSSPVRRTSTGAARSRSSSSGASRSSGPVLVGRPRTDLPRGRHPSGYPRVVVMRIPAGAHQPTARNAPEYRPKAAIEPPPTGAAGAPPCRCGVQRTSLTAAEAPASSWRPCCGRASGPRPRWPRAVRVTMPMMGTAKPAIAIQVAPDGRAQQRASRRTGLSERPTPSAA